MFTEEKRRATFRDTTGVLETTEAVEREDMARQRNIDWPLITMMAIVGFGVPGSVLAFASSRNKFLDMRGPASPDGWHEPTIFEQIGNIFEELEPILQILSIPAGIFILFFLYSMLSALSRERGRLSQLEE